MSFNAEKQSSRDGRAGSMNPPPAPVGRVAHTLARPAGSASPNVPSELRSAVHPQPTTVGLAPRASRPMRDSGVEWIGQVPEGWRVACLFQLASQVKERNEGRKESNLLSLSYGKIKRKSIDTVGGLLPATFDGYNIIGKDDIVLRLTDLQNDQHSLRVGISRERGIITSAYTTLRPFATTCPDFLFYLLFAFDVAKGFYGMGSGVRQGLNYDEVKQLKVALPADAKQQRAIATYLDARCGEIEAAVAAARQSIEDYKALKKSLVFEAVTGKMKVEKIGGGGEKARVEVKGEIGRGERVEHGEEATTNFTNCTTCTGVDFNAEEQRSRDGRAGSMNPPPAAAATSSTSPYQNPCNPCNPWLKTSRHLRDSGVAWIGTVPEGWRVVPLRRLGDLANGISKGGEFFGRGTPFVSYSDVFKNDVLPFEVKGLVEADEEERQRYSVERGDVLFTRTSETVDEIGIAAACLKTIPEATFAGFLIRFRPNGNHLLPEFSRYYFRNKSVSEFFAKELCIVTRASLGQERLKSLPVMIPPVEEQRAIADYLDEKCGAIDALVAEKELLIADLEQYKKSLIFECVTGKREVA